jgi:hypothetical protein
MALTDAGTTVAPPLPFSFPPDRDGLARLAIIYAIPSQERIR